MAIKKDKYGFKKTDYICHLPSASKNALKMTDQEIRKMIDRVVKVLRKQEEAYCYEAKGNMVVFGMSVGDAIEVWVSKSPEQLVFDF